MAQSEFKSLEWFRIQGLGWLAIVQSDQEYDRTDPEIIGKRVLIDEEQFLVKRVERYMLAPPIALGEKIGLLVEECEN